MCCMFKPTNYQIVVEFYVREDVEYFNLLRAYSYTCPNEPLNFLMLQSYRSNFHKRDWQYLASLAVS
jgi:hypothetical protein